MEEFKQAFFGHYTLAIWLGTIMWTLIILTAYKLSKAPKNSFKIGLFINDNMFDMVLNIVLASIMLRGGDRFIDWVYRLANEKLLKGIGLELSPDGMDVVILVAIVVMPISIIIHKYFRKPVIKKVAEKMYVANEAIKNNK